MMKHIYEVCLRCMDEPVERKQPPEDQESVNYCPECGGKMTIMHIYEMCPRCKDALIERKQSFEERDSVDYCPKCGHKLEWALLGGKIDDTTYKIILNDTSFTEHNKRIRFLEILKKIGNLSFSETMEKYKTKDCLIFEGDVCKTYVNMSLLDDFTPDIHYTVVPDFPLERLVNPFVSICPTCGSDTIHKTEDMDVPPNYVNDGFFCEKCNEWVMVAAIPKEEGMLIL